MDDITFCADTVQYGDSIRMAVNFRKLYQEGVHLDFMKIDGESLSYRVDLHPDVASMTDTLSFLCEELPVGAHRLSFYTVIGKMERYTEVPIVVAPHSADFLLDGGLYYVEISSSNYTKIAVPESDVLDVPLGENESFALLTGHTSSKEYGLSTSLFEVVSADADLLRVKTYSVENFRYYFHNTSTDKGECYAVLITLDPRGKGETELIIRFFGRERRFAVRIGSPKNETNI